MNPFDVAAPSTGKLPQDRSHHERRGNWRRGCDSSRLWISHRDPHFAEVCESCNIKFIGPSSQAMQAMGDKNAARGAAPKSRRTIGSTPGSNGIVETESDAIKIARKIGYPVMIKATAGGGGRGMRMGSNERACNQPFTCASRSRESLR